MVESKFLDIIAFSSDCIILTKIDFYDTEAGPKNSSNDLYVRNGDIVREFGGHEKVCMGWGESDVYPVVIATNKTFNYLEIFMWRNKSEIPDFSERFRKALEVSKRPFIAGMYWDNNFLLGYRRMNYTGIYPLDNLLDYEFSLISTGSHSLSKINVSLSIEPDDSEYYPKKLKMFNDHIINQYFNELVICTPFEFTESYILNSGLASLDGTTTITERRQSFSNSEIL